MSQNDNLVSVIIPCHNAELWLEATISSALSQTWRRLEIIVVDDGSTDSSLEHCNRLALQGNVKVIAQSKQGAAAARNRGVEVAGGDWIQFLDADDLLAPDKISVQLERAKCEGSGFLYSSSWGRFYENPETAVFDESPLCRGDLEPVEWLVQKFTGNHMMALHAWLVPRRVLEREHGWDESLSLHDDGEYLDRLVLASGGVRHVREARCYYRSGHGMTLSRTTTRVAAESAMRAIEIGTSRLLILEDSERTRLACAARYQYYAYEFAIHAPDLSEKAEKAASLLGGTDIELPGGPSLRKLAKLAGWRKARWLQHWYYRLRYWCQE